MKGKTRTKNNRVCVFLTLFYKLYKHRVIAAHCQPKAILIFLDDDTTLHKPCETNRQREREIKEWKDVEGAGERIRTW